MNVEVVTASVVAVVVTVLVGGPLRAVRDWCWRRVVASFRRCRNRYQRWQRKRYRDRVEADLDAVLELVRKKDGFPLTVWKWPEELKRLWFEAAVQLIERKVDWDLRFPELGVTVRLRNECMRMDRPGSFFESPPDVESGRFVGGITPWNGS